MKKQLGAKTTRVDDEISARALYYNGMPPDALGWKGVTCPPEAIKALAAPTAGQIYYSAIAIPVGALCTGVETFIGAQFTATTAFYVGLYNSSGAQLAANSSSGHVAFNATTGGNAYRQAFASTYTVVGTDRYATIWVAWLAVTAASGQIPQPNHTGNGYASWGMQTAAAARYMVKASQTVLPASSAFTALTASNSAFAFAVY